MSLRWGWPKEEKYRREILEDTETFAAKTYNEIEGPAFNAYDNAVAQAWKIYWDTTLPLRAAFHDAEDRAYDVYRVEAARAKKVYDDITDRSKRPFMSG